MKHYFLLFLLAFGALTVNAHLSFATTPSGKTEGNKYVRAEIVADNKFLAMTESLTANAPRIGVLFKIKPGWHIYWKNSGDSGIPTYVDWDIPKGFSVSPLQWAIPYKFEEIGDIITYGYKKEVLLFSELKLPKEPITDQSITIRATVDFLACKDVCVPGSYQLTKELSVSHEGYEERSRYYSRFEKYASLIPRQNNQLVSQVISKYSTLSSTQEGFIAILLNGPKSLDITSLSQSVQNFPISNKEVTYGAPYVSKAADGTVAVIFSFRPNKDFSGDLLQLGGVIAFAKDKESSDAIDAVEWSYDQKLGKESFIDPAFPGDTSNAQLASLRFIRSELPAESDNQTGFVLWQVLVAIALGFVAGIILNIMPCVLPVLSLKIFGIIQSTQKNKTERWQASFLFTSGIIVTFFALASIVISLRSLGLSVGWGFQFQQPLFVFFLALVIFLLSLSFFDLYFFNTPGVNKLNEELNKVKASAARDFFDGVFATLLSTPCSAPFLGTALGVAFASPPVVTYAIFLSIGLGLAFPFALVTTSERLLQYFPKPGSWMTWVKELMGIFLLLTVFWLLLILDRQTESGVVWAIGIMLLCFALIWFYRTLSSKFGRIVKPLLIVIGIAVCVLALPAVVKEKSLGPRSREAEVKWQPYTDELVERLKSENKPIFIKFSAEWCLTCKFNETFVLDSQAVREAFKSHGVITLVGDWTNHDEAITKALNRYGANWVPHYVGISGRSHKEFFPGTVITQQSMINLANELAQE